MTVLITLDTFAQRRIIMTTKTLQEIYNEIATDVHAPTAREMVDAMLLDGYTTTEISTQLCGEYLRLAELELSEYLEDRAARIPTDKAWKKLSNPECLAESVALESYKMQVSEAARICKDYHALVSEFNTAKGIAQDTFNATWNTKEESGWVI